jgi:hypothetical protein
MRALGFAAYGCLIALASPAAAQDKDPCPSGMVCANKPSTIVSIMKSMEPKTKVSTGDDGQPLIDVDGPTYDYSIFFMDCNGKKDCAAITFSANFDKDKILDVDLANRWNREHRVPKAYIDKDGQLYLQMEVSTVGGITPANFRDWKQWWDDALVDFSNLYDSESAARDPKNKT